MKKTLATLLALCIAAAALAGCNTMRGFGQDVQKVGDKIEDAASKKK
jgi:predicted small secreted protein